MPRPDARASVQILIDTTRDVDRWCQQHAQALSALPVMDQPGGGAAAAEELEDADRAVSHEAREDVAHTPERVALVDDAQRYLVALAARARLASHDEAPREAVRRFVQRAPSRVRTLAGVQRALEAALAGLDAHGARFEAQRAALREQAEGLLARAQELARSAPGDEQESARAQARLRRARKTVASYLAHAQIAAEALVFTDPQALDDLIAVFDIHNRTHPRRTTADELLELDGDGEEA